MNNLSGWLLRATLLLLKNFLLLVVGTVLSIGIVGGATWMLYTLLAPLNESAARFGIVVCVFFIILAVVLTGFEMDDVAK